LGGWIAHSSASPFVAFCTPRSLLSSSPPSSSGGDEALQWPPARNGSQRGMDQCHKCCARHTAPGQGLVTRVRLRCSPKCKAGGKKPMAGVTCNNHAQQPSATAKRCCGGAGCEPGEEERCYKRTLASFSSIHLPTVLFRFIIIYFIHPSTRRTTTTLVCPVTRHLAAAASSCLRWRVCLLCACCAC
jgi:hypothetical protein